MINLLALPEWKPGQELETPVDLAAVQADDELLDVVIAAVGDDDLGEWLRSASVVLRRELSGVLDLDAGLAHALSAMRREIDAVPVGELVDVDTAVAVIRSARKPRRSVAEWLRGEVLVPVWLARVMYAFLACLPIAAVIVLVWLIGGAR